MTPERITRTRPKIIRVNFYKISLIVITLSTLLSDSLTKVFSKYYL